MSYSEKRLDKDGISSRAAKYIANQYSENDTDDIFYKIGELDRACCELDEAILEAGFPDIRPVEYEGKGDKISHLQWSFQVLSEIPSTFIEEYDQLEEAFNKGVKDKALVALSSIKVAEIFYEEGVEGSKNIPVEKKFEMMVSEIESKVEWPSEITQEDVEEYKAADIELEELKERIEELKSANNTEAYRANAEEIAANDKRIKELEELQAQRLVELAEGGIDINQFEISKERFQFAENYMSESTSEKVSKAFVEYFVKDFRGDTIDEKIINCLSEIEASEENAEIVDVFKYLKGDITPEMVTKSAYNNYTDSQLYQFALHFITTENLCGNEMPKWWMEKYLNVSNFFTVDESRIQRSIVITDVANIRI